MYLMVCTGRKPSMDIDIYTYTYISETVKRFFGEYHMVARPRDFFANLPSPKTTVSPFHCFCVYNFFIC